MRHNTAVIATFVSVLILFLSTVLIANDHEKKSVSSLEKGIDLKIGDKYGGGIVAYIFQPGDPGYVSGEVRGLIVAPKDQGTAQWGCLMIRVDNTSTELGTGRANTIAIVEFHDSEFEDYFGSREECRYNDGTLAAKICNDLDINGFNDWYLPSKDELNILYENRNLIGGFEDADYWSSSEGSGSWSAWFRRFWGSGNQGHGHKDVNHRVRAIRNF